MNALIVPSLVEKTMTSREIAYLCNKEHKNVTADFLKMSDELKIDALSFQRIYRDSMNRAQIEYVLPKDLTLTLVSGYSVQMRKRIIDRWLELESNAPVFAIPATLSGALRLAAEQAETIEQQAQLLAAAQPHIEFVERYVDASGSKGFRQVCKLLDANENRFREFLLEQKIMYRLGSEWVPHAQHLEAKRFEVKAGTSDTNHAFNQARFTPKGVNWIAGLWAQYNLQEQAA